MSSITLHPTLGLNPHLSTCPRCGGDSGLMLIGNNTKIEQCECGFKFYGGADKTLTACPGCLRNFSRNPYSGYWPPVVGHIQEHDKLPGNLCNDCEEEMKKFKSVVDEGGIYFKCAECGKTGVVIATSELAKDVRKHMKIDPPKPCGIEFQKCSEHTPDDTE